MATIDPVVEAIHDLTRVIISVNGGYKTKSEAVRALDALAIPPGRIASIMAMRVNDVSSVIAKAKKSGKSKGDADG